MFATMQSFLFFFIPSVILILLGILFEEKLVLFEARIKASLQKKRRAPKRAKLQKVQKVQKTQKAPRRSRNLQSPQRAA